MSESLASFRDLKGIGPATEARLYEAGVYTWEALGAAASALAAVRGDGDTLREVANLVAGRTEAGGQAALRLPGGERLEAFVLRMTLAAGGEPRRCTVTHVRTAAEQAWAGWTPAELARFIEEHAGLRTGPSPAGEPSRNGDRVPPPSQRRRASPPSQRPSRDHLVVLDAGKAIGGAGRDIDLVVTNTRAAGADFGYRATLAARRLGAGGNGDGWASLASHTGTGHPARELALRFPAVQLPAGVHRLQLLLEVSLPEPARRPPALALA
jgi:hypothetical protein